tara:strand:+ start:94 stop:579 length:486 start_codon:yes stop_codon:yes gene_type:complete
MKSIHNNILQKPYRPCVGLLVINGKGLVFAGKRLDSSSSAWQMPQGGIENGETILEAGLREMKEEIGTNNVQFIGEMKEWLNYDLPKKLVNRLWGGKFRGQTQKWLAYKFLGEDKEININTKNPEFSDWKWVSTLELIKLAIPFKKEIYEKVFKEYSSNLN